MRKVLLASTIALLGFVSSAQAHFNLMSPTPSAVPPETVGGKGAPPCGPDTDFPTSTTTPVMGGHTLHLDVKETVYHPGWYRIALGVNGRSDVPPDPNVYGDAAMTMKLDPTIPNKQASVTSDKQVPAKFPVLAADVWDHTKMATMDFVMDLPIPNFDCPKCVLQIEEFMAQHAANPGGGFYYHHCANINITADHTMPLFVPPGADGGASDAGSGNAGSGGGGTSGAAGAGGTSGSAGAAGGAAGGSTGAGGAAGNTSSGTAGTSGAGGTTSTAGTNGAAGSTGTAGMTGGAGTAGTGGGGGTKPHASSGGCSYANTGMVGSTAPYLVLVAAALSGLLRRRRRR
jgi:hypothetical protein